MSNKIGYISKTLRLSPANGREFLAFCQKLTDIGPVKQQDLRHISNDVVTNRYERNPS